MILLYVFCNNVISTQKNVRLSLVSLSIALPTATYIPAAVNPAIPANIVPTIQTIYIHAPSSVCQKSLFQGFKIIIISLLALVELVLLCPGYIMSGFFLPL